ncbi:MAG: sulfurtransferase TusA family protein [Gammaproteobacteria bacterium]|nr:sulfurtransferase TusA family protein [Gammaproteobacteria bacterium]MDH3560798.1 sulfurtransferase TusA family protein [Gammaproteobacteria bacterium]
MSTETVDARHLLCPLPVIRTQDAMARLTPGDSVRVLCTDPGAIHDIPAWCRVHGHEVCDIAEQDGDILITVRFGGT